jgi:hypothetical protein
MALSPSKGVVDLTAASSQERHNQLVNRIITVVIKNHIHAVLGVAFWGRCGLFAAFVNIWRRAALFVVREIPGKVLTAL